MDVLMTELRDTGFGVSMIADNIIEVYLTSRKVSQMEVETSIELFDITLLDFYHTQAGVLIVL